MDNKEKKEKTLIFNQWKKIIILILGFILLITSLFMFGKCLATQTSSDKVLYSYNYNSNLDYKVYLKNNKFFNTKFLAKDKNYITSIIDYVEINTQYNMQSTQILNYDYSYKVIASVKGNYSGEGQEKSEVWSKEYVIEPEQTKTETTANIIVKNTAKIDYAKYNKIMENFRESFGLSIEANLNVKLQVNVKGSLPGNADATFEETNEIGLNMPLLVATTGFKADYVNQGKQDVIEKTNIENSMDTTLLTESIILLIISLLIIGFMTRGLIKVTKKSEYVIKLNKILKEYSDIIAETDDIPNISSFNVIEIKEFIDMIDIEEELHEPIMFCEIREDVESWFIITHENNAYKYVLKFQNLNHLNDSDVKKTK